MKSIQQQYFEGVFLLFLVHNSAAFQSPHTSTCGKRSVALNLSVDPTDLASLLTGHETNPKITVLLSTALSTATPVAHGHSNPMFGPPDQFLTAGKSIAPSAKALTDMGIAQAKTASDMLPESPPDFQQSVSTAMTQGWKMLNSANIQGAGVNHLPGFSDTHGIFGERALPLESPESFAAEVEWAAGYFNVMDKLPFIAFWYVMLEFFILRPGVDMYKEEIEADPEGALADTVAVGIVRAGALGLITLVTVGFSL